MPAPSKVLAHYPKVGKEAESFDQPSRTEAPVAVLISGRLMRWAGQNAR
jgi:hypothetical protein